MYESLGDSVSILLLKPASAVSSTSTESPKYPKGSKAGGMKKWFEYSGSILRLLYIVRADLVLSPRYGEKPLISSSKSTKTIGAPTLDLVVDWSLNRKVR
jgi:hypothetical protein